MEMMSALREAFQSFMGFAKMLWYSPLFAEKVYIPVPIRERAQRQR